MRRADSVFMTEAMKKTVLVCGFGPGISTSVAETFGGRGYAVGIVSRSKDKLDAGVQALRGRGITADGFVCDLGDPIAVAAMVEDAKSRLGPVAVVQWSAYSSAAGDLLRADKASLDLAMDVASIGLLTAVQTALPDLQAQKGAVLVTNGGLAYSNPQVDAMGVAWKAMGLSVANAAKHKIVGLLSERLKGDGIYVGEIVVMGAVKGTAFDQGQASIEASTIAQAFWDLHEARDRVSIEIAG